MSGGKELEGEGFVHVTDGISLATGTQAKLGVAGLQDPALTAIYRGTSPFSSRQLSPTGHVRGRENSSLNTRGE